MNHSPLPWSVDTNPENGVTYLVPHGTNVWDVCACLPVYTGFDAEFIVRAVNAHDELVAALRLILSRANGCQLEASSHAEPWPEYNAVVEIAEWATAAIAKAEG